MLSDPTMFARLEKILTDDGTIERFERENGPILGRMMIDRCELPEELVDEVELTEHTVVFEGTFDFYDTAIGVAIDVKELELKGGPWFASQSDDDDEPAEEWLEYFIETLVRGIEEDGSYGVPIYAFVNDTSSFEVYPTAPDESCDCFEFGKREGHTVCPECGRQLTVYGWPAFTKLRHPEAAEELMNGTLFELTCPECGYFDLLTYRSLYIDEENGAAVLFERDPQKQGSAHGFLTALLDGSVEGVPQGIARARHVTHVDQMMEKARIFDAGLDDRAVEVAKVYAQQWLTGKDEMYDYAEAFFSEVLDNGNLEFKFFAVVEADNQRIEFFRDKYDEIESDIEELEPEDDCFAVDRNWAEQYLDRSLMEIV